ncbi:hypothetical protein EYC80_009356 [Monilinia laxa]|uniref:amidase n=1 Tax=Monilinia laxa TaxID=61186 RepID=A0A5N6JXR9_MONLA|nr:hypothetical protein EYC80_009356 [Monilinia laxa]
MEETLSHQSNTTATTTTTTTAKMEQKDLHMSAPKHLKEAFKLYKQTTYYAAQGSHSSAGLDDLCKAGIPGESLSAKARNMIFKEFMNTVPSIEPTSPNDELPFFESQIEGLSYGSEVIPGLKVFPSLIPPKVQEELIRRIVHRDLLDPKHMTNLHAHYDVEFPPSETASGDFIVARPKDPTVHPKTLNYREVMTKKLRWITLGGQYDWTNKVYPEEEPPKFPIDIANLVEGLFPDMEPQAAIVNFYSPKDTLQLHRDGAESVDRGLDKYIINSLIMTASNIRMYWSEKLLERNQQLCPKATMPDWQTIAENKRDSINGLIPEKWRLDSIPSVNEQKDVTGDYIQQFLSAREIEITETDAVGIVEKTSSGEWRSREICEAFCHRASLAHQLVNCLHEIFFDDAILEAQKLDDYFAQHKKTVGPLHGLPVSLKDQFHVKGVETSMGYVGWIGTFEGKKGTGKERVFESEMVKELRSLGAILFCKTSVPQTLMAGETVNNIMGTTENPKNRLLGPGGSSGGEGALIGLRGSPVGFGTDVGGSIRIPAAFNGLYGIRPSAGRMPYEGMANSLAGQNTILSVVGPIATTARSLKLVMKSILSVQPWLHDPLVCEIPWRDEQEQMVLDTIKSNGGGQLAFGVFKCDRGVAPQPPVARAIDIVVNTVKRLGHKTIEWTPPSHQRGCAIGSKAWSFDGGKDVHEALALSGEPMIPQIQGHYSDLKPQMTGFDIAAVNVEKREYQKEYMEYWNSTAELTGTGRAVDAIITPLAPMPANLSMTFDYIAYSTFVNLLDYSAAILPVTTVDKNIDLFDHEYTPLNAEDEKVWKCYDPEIYDGAHVSVQIVGRRFQEEKVIAITGMLGEALGK